MDFSDPVYDWLDRHEQPASIKQIQCLVKMGVEAEEGLTYREADRLIKANLDKWSQLQATPGQELFLRRNELWKPGMTRGEASNLINRVKSGRVDY